MQILQEIFELKRRRVEALRASTDISRLADTARRESRRRQPNRLAAAIGRDGINVIAEIKRASPSKGILNAAADVVGTARAYETGGAAAISVLTEEDRFLGSLDDLAAARSAVAIPLLRKDFVFDEFQIIESAAAGADAVLLIAAMLDDGTLERLYAIADRDFGLDAIVEVHTLGELRRAATLSPRLIGINNRDLKTFRVSLDVSRELIAHRPTGSLMIAESGISGRDEIDELRMLGFDGFLIGESLMRSADAAEMLSRLGAAR